jgi:hypothetical protein
MLDDFFSIRSSPLFLLFFVFFSCGSFAFGQVEFECTEHDPNGILSIMIWNSNEGKRYKLEQAQKDALCFVIYNGLELGGNCSFQKTLLTHEDEISKFKQMQATFFAKNGDWSRFIQVITSDVKPTTVPIKKNCKVYSFRLSKNELKSYLESKGVIKNLKTGF